MMQVSSRNSAPSLQENKVTKLKSKYQQLNEASTTEQRSAKANSTPRLISRHHNKQTESVNNSSGSSSGYNSHTQNNSTSNHLLYLEQQQHWSQKHSTNGRLRYQESSGSLLVPTLASQVSQQIENSLQRELQHEHQTPYGYPSFAISSASSSSNGRRQVAPTIRGSGAGAKPLPMLPPPPPPMDDKLYFDDGAEDLIDDISTCDEDNNIIAGGQRRQQHYNTNQTPQHLYQFERRSDQTTEASCLDSGELTPDDVDAAGGAAVADYDNDCGEQHLYYPHSQDSHLPQRLAQYQPQRLRLVHHNNHHHQRLDHDDELSFARVQPGKQEALSNRYHHHHHHHNPQRQHHRSMQRQVSQYLASASAGRTGDPQHQLAAGVANLNDTQQLFAYNKNHTVSVGNSNEPTKYQHRGEFTCLQPVRSHYHQPQAAGALVEIGDTGKQVSKQFATKAKNDTKMQHSNSRQHLGGSKSPNDHEHKSLAARQRQFQQELTRKHLAPGGNNKRSQQQVNDDDERPTLSICGKFAKFLLFITNIVFWSAGVALCAWGVLSLVEDHKYNLSQLLVFDQGSKMSLFQLLSWSFITLGCATVLVGFCGCSAMLKNNRWILGLYIFLILAIFALDLATGLLAIIFQERLVANVRLRLVNKLRTEYGVQASFTAAVDYIQTRYECCGLEGHFDYDQSLWRLQRLGGYEATVARTCCHLRNTFDDQAHINPRPVNESMCQSTDVRFHQSYRYRKGCLDDLERLVRQKIWTFTVGCGAAGGIILLSLLFSTCFCRSIPNSSSSRKSSAAGPTGNRASSSGKFGKHKMQTTGGNHQAPATAPGDSQRHHHHR